MVAIVDNEISGPRLHAFVLGVSRYRHVDGGSDPTAAGLTSQLAQLTSAARSASEFAGWLLNEYHNPDAPLGSLFVCVAPSDDEVLQPDVAAKLIGHLDATRTSVMADWLSFRDRCSSQPDATAIVYVAGHGVQLTSQGATLLLEDFAATGQEHALWAALDMLGLHASLDGSGAARRQFWFIDSCREPPEIEARFESLQGAFCGDAAAGQCEASPIFLAAGPRERAWARVNGVSLFNEALLECLRGAGAKGPDQPDGPWRVVTSSLAEKLVPRVLEASGSARQMVQLAGHLGTTAETLHVFKNPPSAELTLNLLPLDAHPNAKATVYLDDDVVFEHSAGWPLVRELTAGLYTIRIKPAPPYLKLSKNVNVTPPKSLRELTVAE